MTRPALKVQIANRSREQGIALIAVLSLLALLTVLALSVLESSRRHGQLVQRSYEAVQAQEVTDSALRLMLLELSAPRSDATGAGDPRTYDIFGRQVSVSFDYEAGRIDLNAADDLLLTAAFAANGHDEARARVFAQRIVDWRDVDDQRSSFGAERQDYRARDVDTAPRNGLFETVGEIQEVLELPDLDPALLDAFTVYSQRPAVRATKATPATKRALEWRLRRGAEGYASAGNDGTPAEVNSVLQQLAGESVRVRACMDMHTSRYCRIAIVRFTGSSSQPMLTYAWYGSSNFLPILP